jgi:hypothetical protein
MYPSDQQFPMSIKYRPYDKKLSDDRAKEPSKSSHPGVKKPTRPLTAYHIYFQLERELIIQTTKAPDDDNIEIEEDKRPVGLQLDSDMPPRYHNVHLSEDWFASGKKNGPTDQKRKHRKTHGKIAFLDLSKTIASRWATLEETDPVTKEYCTRIAKRELGAYKQRVKVYKASVVDVLTDSLPSSFSSTGTVFSSPSTSPSFDMSPSIIRPTLPTYARSQSSSLTINAGNTSSFQLSPDFLPEWMDTEELTNERPAKWARSSLPDATRTSTNSTITLQADPDTLHWYPDSLPDLIGNQGRKLAQPADWTGRNVASTMTNANANEPNGSKEEGFLSESTTTEPVKDEYTFHPVPCESEDSFLKKYRKLARRTSLFSVRPLHHQVAPLSKSFSNDASTSNISLNDTMDYENITSEPGQCRGFGSIQRKIRNELDERVSQVIKRGWRKGQVQPLPEQLSQGMLIDDSKKGGKKRMSSTISESDRMNSEQLMDVFTLNDTNMLVRALSDKKDSDDMAL